MTAPTPSQWYRLTNAYTGPNLALDVANDNGTSSTGILQMSPSGDFSGQYWQLTPYPSSSSSTYALFTLFLGANKHLDVYGNDPTKPHLADAGDYSGQIWTIAPWGDGTWQLWNQFSGNALHLDTYSDTKQPFLGDGDHTGQHWTFTSIKGTPSSSIPPTPPSSIPATSSSSTTNTSSKASTKAIIGGAVGGGVVLIALICLVAFLLRSKRKRKQADFGIEGKLLPAETGFSTTITAVSDSNRLPNAMTTSSVISSTSPTSLNFNPLITVVPATPLTSASPAVQNPREYHHEPEIMSDSTNFSQTTPSILSSTSSRPLSDRHLSDNQATFLAELLRQGVSASDVPRILEHMGEDGRGMHNEITTDGQLPPAYDFKN